MCLRIELKCIFGENDCQSLLKWMEMEQYCCDGVLFWLLCNTGAEELRREDTK